MALEKYFKTSAYLSTLPILSGDSRFRGFFPTTRSQQKISRFHYLSQNLLNLKFNQFFEKLINFVREPFFRKGKEQGRQYGTFRIFVLRTSYLSLIFKAYRTKVTNLYHSRKGVPYQRTILLSKN